MAILAFGTLFNPALEVAEALDYTIADMRFVKPLDEGLIENLANTHDLLVTIEENAIMGGAGSAVIEHMNSVGIHKPVLQLGLPDSFIDHGKHEDLLSECGLNRDGIKVSILRRLELLGASTQFVEKKTVSVMPKVVSAKQELTVTPE